MKELKRWAITNRIYLMLFALIAIMAYIDVMQIRTFFGINTQAAWDLYNTYTLPAFIYLWITILALPAIVYYMFVKDKSEAIGLFVAGAILLFTGVEDVFFFAFSSQNMTQCMQWFNDLGHPVAWWGEKVFQQSCVSPEALVSFAIFGVFVSYFVYKWFRNRGYKGGKRVGNF